MEIQGNISLENNVNRVGRIERIIIDSKEGDYHIGRTQYDSPEVDQEILVKTAKKLKAGDFVTVRITAAEQYDLYAEPI